MKIRTLFLATIFAAAHVLLGCEQDMDLDKYKNPETAGMLVVNSILNPDSVMGVSVTHPFFLSDTHVRFKPVEGLKVEMKGGDGASETLNFDPVSGLYKSSRCPSPGERLSVCVTGDGQSATAEDIIPRKVSLESVTVTAEGPIHIYWDNDYRFTYKITFSDPADEENFYFLAIEDAALSYEFSDFGQVDYTADYVFQVLAGMINSDIQGWQPDGVFGYPFCDKGIDGRRYTLTVTETLQSPWVGMIETLPRRVNLYTISKPYFEYMVSVLSMDYDETALKGGLLSLGLVEPDKIYTNVVGGTGLMGCFNLCTLRVDLLQLTGGWPGNK